MRIARIASSTFVDSRLRSVRQRHRVVHRVVAAAGPTSRRRRRRHRRATAGRRCFAISSSRRSSLARCFAAPPRNPAARLRAPNRSAYAAGRRRCSHPPAGRHRRHPAQPPLNHPYCCWPRHHRELPCARHRLREPLLELTPSSSRIRRGVVVVALSLRRSLPSSSLPHVLSFLPLLLFGDQPRLFFFLFFSLFLFLLLSFLPFHAYRGVVLTRISRSRVVENGVSGACDPVGQGSDGTAGPAPPHVAASGFGAVTVTCLDGVTIPRGLLPQE
ncbi:hypothetical protein Syun_004871 [Stephania yunnanensis]|uniref:Uncharacterized protein n=1 Tax=Stephania yunnanensis TaxID=152371 RepID=A0AAP0L766_9MAGN